VSTFLLTGATGGFAPFAARRLLERDDRLVLMARDAGALRSVADQLGAGVATFAGSASDPAACAAAVSLAVEQFGGIDGLVALAGAAPAPAPVAMAEPGAYTSMFEANVLTAAMASQAVVRQLSGPAWFVYMSSLLAKEPMPTMSPYAAAKAALNAWARGFSREVKDRDIRVNVIETSLIDTPKNRAQQPGMDYSQWVPAEQMADVVAFLTSEGAAAMLGGVIPVPGRFALIPAMMGGGGGPPPPAAGNGGAAKPESKRYALLYPFKPGRAEEAEELFRAGADPPPNAGGSTRLLATTVFRFGDTVVRSFEIEGSLDEAIEHMVIGAALSDLGVRLKPLLDEGVDLTTPEGLRHFFRTQLMEVVTDRVAPGR